MDPLQASAQPPGKHRLFWILVACLIAGGLCDWWYERHKEKRFDLQIVRAARQHGVEPALVKAVVWRESKFNPRVRGRVGEVGLMQIRPGTADEWAQSMARSKTFEGDLFNPETNLEIGAWYLSKLLRRYGRADDPVSYALADYNAGRSNVLRWNKGPASTNSQCFLGQITFPGTQTYVRTIERRALRYRASF